MHTGTRRVLQNMAEIVDAAMWIDISLFIDTYYPNTLDDAEPAVLNAWEEYRDTRDIMAASFADVVRRVVGAGLTVEPMTVDRECLELVGHDYWLGDFRIVWDDRGHDIGVWRLHL